MVRVKDDNKPNDGTFVEGTLDWLCIAGPYRGVIDRQTYKQTDIHTDSRQKERERERYEERKKYI